jgi:hypothetical protein
MALRLCSRVSPAVVNKDSTQLAVRGQLQTTEFPAFCDHSTLTTAYLAACSFPRIAYNASKLRR